MLFLHSLRRRRECVEDSDSRWRHNPKHSAQSVIPRRTMPGMKFFRGWISGKAFQIDARSAIDFEDIGNSQLVLVQD